MIFVSARGKWGKFGGSWRTNGGKWVFMWRKMDENGGKRRKTSDYGGVCVKMCARSFFHLHIAHGM